MIPRAVCVLASRQGPDGPEILAVSRRDDHTAFGLPGGKVEKDEDFFFAAARELYEETGLLALQLVQVFTCICEGDVSYDTTTFIANGLKGELRAQEGEGLVAWVRPQVLLDGPFGEYNKKLFEAAGITA